MDLVKIMFGKKPKFVEPQLVNNPSEKIVKLAVSSKQEETVEFYLIDTRYSRTFEGKELFALNDLERLLTLERDRIDGPYKLDPRGDTAYLYFTPYTDGKSTVRLFSGIFLSSWNRSDEEKAWYSNKSGLKKGEPLFKTNEETNELTFYPSFFRAIALVGKRLLRIQAPVAWHQDRRTRVDPEIEAIWEPKWQ